MEKLGDLPTGAVIFQSSFVVESAAYIIGGSTGEKETGEVYRYDPEQDFWTRRADFPGAPRQAAVSFGFGALGFIGGGHSKFEELFNDYYVFTPYANTWAKYEGTVPFGRAWATGVTTNNSAFIGTGFDFENFHNDWWEFGTELAGVSKKKDNEQRLMEFYPNPTSHRITLDLSDAGELTIFDMLGRTVESMNANAGRSNIDLQQLPQGVYHVRLRSGNKEQTEVLHITR